MADHARDSTFADPDMAMPWPCFSEWLCPILPQQTVRGVRASSQDSDSVGNGWGDYCMPVIVDDVSFSLDCSGCRMPVLVSAPEG